MKRKFNFLGIAFLFVFGNSNAANDSLYWYTYFADSISAVEGYTKIRTDSSGHLKMVYRNGHKVSYIDYDGKSFHRSVADSGLICCDAKIAMDLDRNGNVHMLRQDEEYKAIYYVEQDGLKWKRTFIDSVGTQGVDFYALGIVVDKNNTSHIFYPKLKGNAQYMHYRTIDKLGVISESTQLCPECGYHGKWAGITLDSADKPWISFFIHNLDELGLIHLENGSWKRDTVDTLDNKWEVNSGYYSDIKTDTSGNFLISYQNYTESKIMLASGNESQGWKIEPVDTIMERTYFSSQSALATDGKGTVYLAYTIMNKKDGGIPTHSQLMLATKKNGVWNKQILDTAGIVGEYASITITSEGLPAIAYYDRTNEALKLMIARSVAPLDSNNNGIPDYKETGVKQKSKLKIRLKASRSENKFDSLGRRVIKSTSTRERRINFQKN